MNIIGNELVNGKFKGEEADEKRNGTSRLYTTHLREGIGKQLRKKG